MYPRDAIFRLISMVKCGLLDLSGYQITGFALPQLADAIANAATTSGPFNRTVLKI